MKDINQELLEALEWMLLEDDTWDIPNNGYWIKGYENARKAVARAKGEKYVPKDWDNWEF